MDDTALMARNMYITTVSLADNPRRVGKPLSGELSGLHSARRGEYRVIYRIREDVLVIESVRIAHRRDAYRR